MSFEDISSNPDTLAKVHVMDLLSAWGLGGKGAAYKTLTLSVQWLRPLSLSLPAPALLFYFSIFVKPTPAKLNGLRQQVIMSRASG